MAAERPWCIFASGSRDLGPPQKPAAEHSHFKMVHEALAPYVRTPHYLPGCALLHGDGFGRDGARGADAIIDMVARTLGFAVYAFPAQWTRLGKRAGPLRNGLCAEVLEAFGRAGYRMAFVSFSTGGPGTEGATKLCERIEGCKIDKITVEPF